MNILLTGAFGNIGLSILEQIKEHSVTCFDSKSNKNYKSIQGDIRDQKLINSLVAANDVVIHLAAIIPPAADRDKNLTWSINYDGTKNIVDAVKQHKKKLIFASSIAVYGDRINSPYIRIEDSINPNDDDEYAKTKIACEKYIKESNINYVILRLSYIVWKKKLNLDPIMFKMPLFTSIEICDTKDAALAFINAIDCKEAEMKTLNIAGGIKCRTMFRDYLDKMMRLFGIGGSGFLTEHQFANKGYHCGFMDTEESERILHYQKHTLEDYYREVKRETLSKRMFAWLIFLIIRRKIYSLSPYK